MTQAQLDPAWFSRSCDRFWRSLALTLTREAKSRHDALRAAIAEEMKKLPAPPEVPESDERELSTQGTYGQLPEIRVDSGHGAIFPLPIQPPSRFSWYQATARAGKLFRTLKKLDRAVDRWKALAPDRRAAGFAESEALLEQAQTEFSQLAQHVRYLEAWVPQLERQWLAERAKGTVPASYLVTQALQEGDPRLLDPLREVLRPRRVLKRSFLPDSLVDVPGGVVNIPIATDVRDKKFLSEVEGALDTHWNQSPWARENGISFFIHWVPVLRDRDYASGKTGISEHIERFPANHAVMTTGGLTTHVQDRALILGPGKLNPRTLAHELGHLIGFGDCYMRTLSGQGFFGLGVLEWDNPLYPDDLMCDNTVGVPRAEAW